MLSKYYNIISKHSFQRFTGKPLKLFLIADTHIKASVEGDPNAEGAKRESDKRYYYTSPDKLREFVVIANAEKPDLILHVGDIAEDPAIKDFDLFLSIWNTIDPSIPKYFTIGNHDITFDDNEFNDNVSDYLGIDDRSTIVGSKFNYSFAISNENQSLRVILIDTNRNIENEWFRTSDARLSTQLRSWIDREIREAKEDSILIAMHHGAHVTIFEDTYSFNERDGQRYLDIISKNLQSTVTRKKIISVFGHYHTEEGREYPTNNSHALGRLVPTMVLNENSYFLEINLTPNGIQSEKLWNVSYPYES